MTSKDVEDLLYRVTDNNALQAPAAAAEEQNWDGWNRWIKAHILNERQVMAQAMGEVVAETCKELRQERDAVIAPLKAEIAELRGQVTALLTLLGHQKSVSSNASGVALRATPENEPKVIDLPAWRAKDVG